MLRLRRAGGLLATAVLLTGLAVPAVTVPTLAGRALADPPRTSAEARQQATALRTEVDRLTVQAESATESYDAVRGALDELTTQMLVARAAVQRAEQSQSASLQVNRDNARALYMTGGPLALYAAALQGSDPNEALAQIGRAGDLLDDGRLRSDQAGEAVLGAEKARTGLAALQARQRDLTVQAAARAADVQQVLDVQQRLVAAADAQVVALAEAERRAAAEKAQQEFLARVVAAQVAAAEAAARSAAGAAQTGQGATAVSLAGAVGSDVGRAAVAAARRKLGLPYLWGGTGPGAYDCSGLTGYAYAAAGIRLPRTAQQQWSAGPHVALADLQVGDLLFWASDTADPRTIHHVAIYAGNGRMIAAPHTGAFVQEQAVYLDGYIGAVRPSAAQAAAVAGPAWRGQV